MLYRRRHVEPGKLRMIWELALLLLRRCRRLHHQLGRLVLRPSIPIFWTFRFSHHHRRRAVEP